MDAPVSDAQGAGWLLGHLGGEFYRAGAFGTPDSLDGDGRLALEQLQQSGLPVRNLGLVHRRIDTGRSRRHRPARQRGLRRSAPAPRRAPSILIRPDQHVCSTLAPHRCACASATHWHAAGAHLPAGKVRAGGSRNGGIAPPGPRSPHRIRRQRHARPDSGTHPRPPNPTSARPDDFYEALIDMHRDLDDAQSRQAANARPDSCCWANHIGDHDVLLAAMRAAREDLVPGNTAS
ncbi:DUF2783 domain-containing protein [Cupriavidus basilensis]